MRVLLADPDDVFLEVAQSLLWDRGHEAVECMSILREFLSDVLVLDRDLRWGGSEGVLALVKEDQLLARISVILTADRNTADRLVALSSPPAAYLVKPYRLSELLARINSLGPASRSPRRFESVSCQQCNW
jgi:DNA-binding response OmpR family regulator